MLKYIVPICLCLFLCFSNNIQAYCLSSYCLPFPVFLDYQPSGFYVSAFGGIAGGYDLTCRNVKTNRGYYFGVNGGKKVLPNFRVEGDAMWQGNDVNALTSLGTLSLDHVRGSIDIGSVMANGILDFNFPFPGSPSIGAGVGYAWADGDWKATLSKTVGTLVKKRHFRDSFSKNGFAWQLIADLNFFICNDFKINIEYRFFKLSRDVTTHKFGLAAVKFF